MFTKVLKTAACSVVLLCFGIAAQAQNNGTSTNCARIDKNNPPLFVTFEGTESKSALLRLHNNSRCSVLIPTNQLEGFLRIVRQPDGRLKFERIEDMKDGGRAPVVFLLFNQRGLKDTVIVSDGCMVFLRALLPQQSVLFAVPLDHFKKNADVAVEFIYPWEKDNGSAVGGSFGHYVFFRNEYLPKGVIR
jgi:hypothetical protein